METKKTEDIIVSIITLTYNHEPYIRECLDGILMQQTSFKFESLIHDDASTDNTANIIREYATKYPNIIKPIYQTENQYSQKVPIGCTYLYPRAQGKYIALCEGDDYWTDPLKLQKQVDFLESHPDYVMCSHRFKQYMQKEDIYKDDWYGEVPNGITYDLNSLIQGFWFHTPLTVMFRRDSLCLAEYEKYPNSKDATLFFHLLQKGRGFMIPEFMGMYRVHSGGVWSGVSEGSQMEADFKNRIGIYTVEQSYEAAFFLRQLFAKPLSRKWMLQEWKTMMASFKIISKHFGYANTSKMFLKKLLLNQDLIH